MSSGQLNVYWSSFICLLVKFYMSTGQLYVYWSSFICLLVNFMSTGQVLYVYWSSFICLLVNFMSTGQVLYVYWSTLCLVVKFSDVYLLTLCLVVYFMSSGQVVDWQGITSGGSGLLKEDSWTFLCVSCLYPDYFESKIFFGKFITINKYDPIFENFVCKFLFYL